ncbi:unnamed protein product [Diamesa serratosioi]
MGVRLLLLAALGLGALYSIHLLAGDWMKIQSAAGAAKLFLGKRDVEQASVDITKLEIKMEEKIDWENVLNKDPLKCALSLVCQLAAGAEKENKEANQIYEFILSNIEKVKVPKRLKKSFEEGQDYNQNGKEDFEKCYKNFPICPYSAKTMMKLIQFNNYLFG